MTRTNIATNELPANSLNRPVLLRSAVRAALLFAGLAAWPGAAGAADVKVENYGNDTIFVAVAYNKWLGRTAVEGWFEIKPNGSRTFRANNAQDMHLRIERNDKEVTFADYKTFHHWPVSAQRFTVTKEPDDDSIRVLKWGDKLQHSHNVLKGGKLPAGWASQRFFQVGPKNVTLEVLP